MPLHVVPTHLGVAIPVGVSVLPGEPAGAGSRLLPDRAARQLLHGPILHTLGDAASLELR